MKDAIKNWLLSVGALAIIAGVAALAMKGINQLTSFWLLLPCYAAMFAVVITGTFAAFAFVGTSIALAFQFGRVPGSIVLTLFVGYFGWNLITTPNRRDNGSDRYLPEYMRNAIPPERSGREYRPMRETRPIDVIP